MKSKLVAVSLLEAHLGYWLRFVSNQVSHSFSLKLGERGVSSGTIQTNSENFRIRGVNLTGGDSSLDRLKLLRSTAGEGQDVDGEKDVLLAAIVAELHGFPLVAEKSKLRGRVTDLKGHFGDL